MDGMDLGVVERLPNLGSWDFAEARPDPLSRLHPYPAKFIPELPRRLIAAFPPKNGHAVLDPFCGSGTTLSEAQRAGSPSYGVDLNPIATLISRVRTMPMPASIGRVLSRVDEAARSTAVTPPTSIPRLDHWFKADVQAAVASIVAAIEDHGQGARDVLRLALSSILVRVSNQDSDTRYAAVEKAVDGEDVHRLFVRATRRMSDTLAARDDPLPRCGVVEGNVLDLEPTTFERPVGLVVTSPPYPNAYEYWLYHKYRMWWLGFDPLHVKEHEIGARAHFFRGRSSHTVEDFGRQMANVMALLRDVLVPNGHACFVVGRSLVHGEIVDNAEVIARQATMNGFVETLRTERTIASTRKSFNLSHANIKTETVLVLQRLG